MPKQPTIRAFFDEPTNTVSYLVADPATRKAVIIDPVLDYDHNAGTVDTRSVETILKAAHEAGFTVEWVLETHAGAVADVVGIRCGAISGNMKVSFQAARSIG